MKTTRNRTMTVENAVKLAAVVTVALALAATSHAGIVNGDFSDTTLTPHGTGAANMPYSGVDTGWHAKSPIPPATPAQWVITGGQLTQPARSGSETRAGQVFRASDMNGTGWDLELDVGGGQADNITVWGGVDDGNNTAAQDFMGFGGDGPPEANIVTAGWTNLVDLEDVDPSHVVAPIAQDLSDFDLIAMKVSSRGTGRTFDNIEFVQGGGPPPTGLPIDDHFDNGDLGTDVNGVNGGFTKLSNSAGGAGTASEAGTNATLVTTGGNDNTGIVSNHSFDAAGTAPSGFEMSFVVTSLSSDPGNNGMFLGLMDDGTSFYRNIDNYGLVFSGNESRTSSGGGFGLILNDIGSPGADVIFDHADLELSSLLDGFEATITADETGWSYEITGVNDTSGLPAVFSGADTWVNAGLAADFFSTQFDAAEYVAAWTQRGGGGNPNITTNIDRISVGAVSEEIIPEPATMALLGLACAGLGGYVRRRRRAVRQRL